MQVHVIETPSLGDRSYLVTDGVVAAVIDPQRDLDRILGLVEEHGLRIAAVFETHVHNDYVTGGLELARSQGASYHVAAEEEVDFDRSPIADGDEVTVGSFTIRAVHTPGHTHSHLSYVANDGERDVAVFSGGSMLYGTVGRTDLVSDEATEPLTRAQFRSVRRLADELPEHTEVHPTHGFGSFCSAGETAGRDTSTIGQEQVDNQALVTDDEDDFVRDLLAGLDDYPAYYTHMGPINRSGPSQIDLAPVEQVDVVELRRRIHAGEWVVDLRSRMAFAQRHLAGTVNIELSDSASTHLGWLIDWGTPVTLLADTADEVAQMQRQLVRIGIDRPAGQHTGGLEDVADGDLGAHRVVDFAELAAAVERGDEPWILDVRQDLEWADGHLAGANHLPLHELLTRLDEVPTDREVWVHCASGQRATIAASLLARSGRRPVLVDDDFPTKELPCVLPPAAVPAATPPGPAAASTSTR